MRWFIDERGQVRDGDTDAIATELGIVRPDFDVAAWAIKALGWIEFTAKPRRSLRWRPSQLRSVTAATARELVIETDPLASIEMIRWVDGWKTTRTDGMVAAWTLGEAIKPGKVERSAWTITRRSVGDLYRDRNLPLIEDLSRIAGRMIDREAASEIAETAPSGRVGVVESRSLGKPFHYLRVGRRVRLFDKPEAFIGRDLRESSDPAFSAACVPSYEAAMVSDDPIVEDIEGPIQLADGRTIHVAYRRMLVRVDGRNRGPAIVMKSSFLLNEPESAGV